MRLLAALSIALPALLLSPSACDSCGSPLRCTYATLLLLVHDANGDLLPQATVTESGSPIGTDLTQVTCASGGCTHAVSPGTGVVTISLQGYQDAVINFVQRADSCGYGVIQFAEVRMQRIDSSTASVVSALSDRGSGCN